MYRAAMIKFEQEKCVSCGKEGELVERDGMYRWRCRSCGQSWIRVGSKMDVINEIVYGNLAECDQ